MAVRQPAGKQQGCQVAGERGAGDQTEHHLGQRQLLPDAGQRQTVGVPCHAERDPDHRRSGNPDPAGR